MLSCLLNNQRINCYDETYTREQLKKWAAKKILLCPACGKPYEYCHGKVKSPYFRHMDKIECQDKYSEPETEEHLKGKIDLYEWIKKQNDVTDVVLEGWISETKQRPDIIFKYHGKQYVIEYQCTPIASEYYERHDLYKAAGIIDIWILGTEKYFTGRHKFIEDIAYGYYDYKSKRFYLKTYSVQKRVLESFKKLNRKYEHEYKIDNYIFHDGDIIFYCLKNQDYKMALDRHNKRKTLRQEIKRSDTEIFENKIERIKSKITSCKVTIHYPNYWDHTSTYIRFFRKSNNTFCIKDTEHFYLKINNVFRVERINNLLNQYNKKSKTWEFYIDHQNLTLYIDVKDHIGRYIGTNEIKLKQNQLIEIDESEDKLKNLLLRNMIDYKNYLVNQDENIRIMN